MLIQTHVFCSMAVGAALSSSAAEFAACVVGGVLPDMIDSFLSFGSRTLFWKVHRTISHWIFWPIVVWIIAYGFFVSNVVSMEIVNMFCFGLATHVGLDVLTPAGIPFWHPFGGKKSVCLIKNRSFAEFGLVLVSVCAVVFVVYVRLGGSVPVSL